MSEFARAKLQQYHISWESAHLLVARSCMCYISICLKHGQGTAPADVSNDTGASSKRTDRLHPMSQRLLDYALDDALNHFGYLGSKFGSALSDITILAEDIRKHSEIWDNVCLPARWEISTKPHWPAARHDLLLYILVAFASNPFMSAFFHGRALKPKEGTNPLVYAAHFNKDKHARTLLLLGARLHHRGWEASGFRQSLPIEVAFQNRHYAMITHFVEEGSTVPPHIFTDSFFKRDNFFNAPSFRAPVIPSSIARVLVQTDDFAENINICLNEAAWRAVKTSNQLLVFADATEEDLIAIARRFIQVADEHFTPNSISEAFLCFAIAQGYFSAAQYLLTIGTPLPSDLLVRLHHHSGRWKTARMIRFLVDKGADVLVHTSCRDSVLHATLWAPGGNPGYSIIDDAVEDDILGAVKLLVGYGCDPLEADSGGSTPLHIAVERGHISVARYLLTLGASLPPDPLATLECRGWRSTSRMIPFLVENGVNVHAHSIDGDSVLHIMLQSSYKENDAMQAVKLLVGYGCDPLEADDHGRTPLHIAVKRGYISLAQYLLTLGAHLPPDLFVTLGSGTWGSTARMIRFLVENGVNVHTHTIDGDSVLHIMLQSSYKDSVALETVKLLVGYGCDPLEVDSRGRNPLHIAVEQGHISVARHLITLGASLPPDLLVTLESGAWQSTARTIRFLVENGANALAHNSNGDSVLHIALQSFYNDNEALVAVRLLVGYGCDPLRVEPNSRGSIPLHIAAERGHISAARYLLALGAPLPPDLLVTLNRDWPLWSTVCMLRLLVENGANPLAHADDGDSVLHIVLQCSSDDDKALEAVKLLVGYGSDPLEANPRGNTPLHIAVERGHISAARYLLSLSGSLPPDLLVTLNHGSRWSTAPMIHFLVENGVNIHAHTSDGDPVFHIALCCLNSANHVLEAVKVLVGYGCDPLEANSHGNTPLHIAVKRGHISAARYLLTLGAPHPPDLLVTLNHDRSLWSTPTAPMIRLLVKNGADVFAHSSDGDSVIHIALRYLRAGNDALEAVKLLVGYGCDPLEANSRGNTPLHIAVEKGYISAARYLLTLGAPLPPDLLVTFNRHRSLWSTVPMIRFLVKNGVDVHAHGSYGDSVVHTAVRCFNTPNDVLDAVKLLVGYGCDPLEANSRGVTSLHIAAERSCIPVARYLITQGASVLTRVSNGDTVLHFATGGPHRNLPGVDDDDRALEAVKFLVGCGCDPAAPNDHWLTPLHIAVDLGRIKTMKYLLSLNIPLPRDILFTAIESDNNSAYCRYITATLVTSGCDISDGDTPLRAAVMKGKVDVVEYLLLTVASMHHPPLEDLLSTAELVPPSVQSKMKRMLSDCLTKSGSPDLPPGPPGGSGPGFRES